MVADLGAGNAEVVARVTLPSGLECVEGDTLVRIDPDKIETWVVRARATGAGPFEIRGAARAEKPDGVVDELEWKIVVAPGDHDGVSHNSHNTRVERVVGGNRYRWMSGCLVPVAEAEAFSERDIGLEGVRAHPVEPAAVVAPDVKETIVTSLLVIVDATGGVIAVAPWRGLTAAARSAMEAVRGWRFEPTHFRGRTISDLVMSRSP
jgi:hypothetical protein